MTSCIQFKSWCFADLDQSSGHKPEGNWFIHLVNPQYSLYEQGNAKGNVQWNRFHLIIALLAIIILPLDCI
jgi:hypothetical protein